jgi:hypothetical protein
MVHYQRRLIAPTSLLAILTFILLTCRNDYFIRETLKYRKILLKSSSSKKCLLLIKNHFIRTSYYIIVPLLQPKFNIIALVKFLTLTVKLGISLGTTLMPSSAYLHYTLVHSFLLFEFEANVKTRDRACFLSSFH